MLGSMQERCFARGGFIARAGHRTDEWIGLLEGFVKMTISFEDGRVSTLAGMSAGAWLGAGSLMAQEIRRYDVLAMQPTHAVLIPRRTFEWLRQTSLPFNHYLQESLYAKLRRSIGALEHERLADTDARIAHCIARFFSQESPQAGGPRFMRVDQGEIGLMANVSRQRANIGLQRLQALGFVRIEKRGLTVLDMAGLREYRHTHGKDRHVAPARDGQGTQPQQTACG